MSRIKNKNLLKLNKIIEPQKKKFGWTPNLFSYKFDYRSKRLIINYTVPTQVYEKGKVKVLMKHARTRARCVSVRQDYDSTVKFR